MLQDLIVGLALMIISAISAFILQSIRKVLGTQKDQGDEIASLNIGMNKLLQVNKIQTDNITATVPVARDTIKATRSVCYAQQEELAGELESAKKSVERAFELINKAEDNLNRQADMNAGLALAVGGK